jgi:hypothetical protein
VKLGRRSRLLRGRRGSFHLVEVQCTELVGDELQTSELESLGRWEQ